MFQCVLFHAFFGFKILRITFRSGLWEEASHILVNLPLNNSIIIMFFGVKIILKAKTTG